MVMPDFIFSFIVALVISLIFAKILHRQGPRKGFLWFFLTIYLAVLAVGIWTKPLDEQLSNTNWFPFLLAGIVMALLLNFLAPKYPKVKRESQLDREKTLEMLDSIEREKQFEILAYISFNLFFWVMIILLVGVIISRYIF